MWTRENRGRTAGPGLGTKRHPSDPTDEEGVRLVPLLRAPSRRRRNATADPATVPYAIRSIARGMRQRRPASVSRYQATIALT